MARFRVKAVGVSELEEMAINTTSDIRDAEATHKAMLQASDEVKWQGCIFKVGDDVRQVGVNLLWPNMVEVLVETAAH